MVIAPLTKMKSTKVQNPWRFYSACANTIRRRNNALIYVVKYKTHARFPRSIKDGRLAIAVLYRKRSNSATEHFQRKPHKCSDLPYPLKYRLWDE